MYEQEKAAYRSHPPEAARSKAFDAENYPKAAHKGQPVRLPAYAKSLRPRPDRSLIVIVGQSGWSLFDRGRTTNAILLPDPNPALYRWPSLAGWSDALLIDASDSLSSDAAKAIAVALLASGLPRVVTDHATYARRPS